MLDYKKPWKWPDIYLFTGNTTITKDKRLVMGRGGAKEVRDTYPGIDKRISINSGVSFTTIDPNWKIYDEIQYIGYFKVKEHYRDKAKLSLIRHSTQELDWFAKEFPNNTFHMNFPGIGAGGLPYEEVLEIVLPLPDNVILYV